VPENSYVISGEIGIYLGKKLLGTVKEKYSTHSPLEMLGISLPVHRQAIHSSMVAPLPKGDPLLIQFILEKTCIEPCIRHLNLRDAILSFDSAKTMDFAAFLNQLGIKIEPKKLKIKAGHSHCFDECMVWVKEGSLNINGVSFRKNRVFGYLGLIFSSASSGFKIRAEVETVVNYVNYGNIHKNVLIDVGILREAIESIIPLLDSTSRPGNATNNDPASKSDARSQDIVAANSRQNSASKQVIPIIMALTVQWLHIPAEFQLIRKNTICNEIYLLDEKEIGYKECILGLQYSEEYITTRTVDVTRIPKGTIETILKHSPGFYKLYMQRALENKVASSKTILITPAQVSCQEFVSKLHQTTSANSILIRPKDILMVIKHHENEAMCDLLLLMHLQRLRDKYKIILIYMENKWSKMAQLCGNISNIIFVVGYTPVPNQFSSRSVEFVQLYDREQVKRKPSLLKKILSHRKRIIGKRSDEQNSSGESSEGEGSVLNGTILGSDAKPNGGNEEIADVNPLPEKGGAEKLGDELPRRRPGTSTSSTHYSNPSYRRIHHISLPKSKSYLGPKVLSNDFERLGRYLLDQRIGLVLGGGGARGFAHIGAIKALEEEGIPIDCIGGTSMGAFIGALYADRLNFVEMYMKARNFARVCSSAWAFLIDITYPFVSVFTGRSLDRALRRIFEGDKIQNLWVEFYCITTNLINYEECVHFYGPLSRWVRASMSICGYLPPIVYRNEYYVDGAYVNNVPVDIMKSLGVSKIIAVDVGDVNDTYDPYDSSSGLILLFKRYFTSKRYMSLREMQYRLAFLSTEAKIRMLEKETLLVRPRMDSYRTSDFKRFDEIVACGYEATKQAIKEWKGSGRVYQNRRRIRRHSL